MTATQFEELLLMVASQITKQTVIQKSISAEERLSLTLTLTAHVDTENVRRISQKYNAYILKPFEIHTMIYYPVSKMRAICQQIGDRFPRKLLADWHPLCPQ